MFCCRCNFLTKLSPAFLFPSHGHPLFSSKSLTHLYPFIIKGKVHVRSHDNNFFLLLCKLVTQASGLVVVTREKGTTHTSAPTTYHFLSTTKNHRQSVTTRKIMEPLLPSTFARAPVFHVGLSKKNLLFRIPLTYSWIIQNISRVGDRGELLLL